ncbi:MAG: hypothetical protein ACJAV1_003137 [Paraglaciecola sp.]|jgi:hypothetical protein
MLRPLDKRRRSGNVHVGFCESQRGAVPLGYSTGKFELRFSYAAGDNVLEQHNKFL